MDERKYIDTKELKEIQLYILDKINEFCKNNNIKYYLGYGTLLGAIRHKGYIPWDDDIDICLKRKDYDFLIRNFSDDRVKIIYSEKCEDFYLTFAKAVDTLTVLKEDVDTNYNIGVFVDIFPLDEIPNSKLKKVYLKSEIYLKMLTLKNLSRKKRTTIKNIILNVGKFLLYPVTKKYLINKIDRNAKKYINSNSEIISNLAYPIYHKKDIWRKEDFDEVITVTFEDREYLAPKGYDNILKSLYGKYMELPPVEKRVTHHDFIAYWKDGVK